MTTPEDRLQALGLTLPEVGPPLGSYVHAVQTGNLLFLAGKGPSSPADPTQKVGREISVEQAYADAKATGLTLIAVMKQELGELSRVARVVKVLGMVNAVPEFGEHPAVINGCSDLLVQVFGEAGKHARSAVGMGSLPRGISVEIEAIVEVLP